MTVIFPHIPGFDYVKKPHADLVTEMLAIPGYTHHLHGLSVEGRPIYGLSLGDLQNKPVIYVEGNLHGLHEWRNPYWIMGFMRHLQNPAGLPTHQHTLEYLKSKYAFYFAPSTNPDGYENNYYQNANGVNLNRNFDFRWSEGGDPTPGTNHYRGSAPFSEPETQYERDKVLELKPVGFVACHSWGGQRGLTVSLPANRDMDVPAGQIMDSAKLSLGEGGNPDHLLSPRLIGGLASSWAGAQQSRQGRRVSAFTIEAGDQATEREQARMGMTGLLAFCKMVDQIHTTGDLILKR